MKNTTLQERKCIVIEIGLSFGILYSKNWTLGIKDYTKRVSKHDDDFFNSFLSSQVVHAQVLDHLTI